MPEVKKLINKNQGLPVFRPRPKPVTAGVWTDAPQPAAKTPGAKKTCGPIQPGGKPQTRPGPR